MVFESLGWRVLTEDVLWPTLARLPILLKIGGSLFLPSGVFAGGILMHQRLLCVYVSPSAWRSSEEKAVAIRAIKRHIHEVEGVNNSSILFLPSNLVGLGIEAVKNFFKESPEATLLLFFSDREDLPQRETLEDLVCFWKVFRMCTGSGWVVHCFEKAPPSEEPGWEAPVGMEYPTECTDGVSV